MNQEERFGKSKNIFHTSKLKIYFLIFLFGPLFLIVIPSHAIIIYNLDVVFSGDTPAGTSPYLRVTYDDEGTPGSVKLTMEAVGLDSTGLPKPQIVNGSKGWYFNFDDSLNVEALSYNYLSGVQASSINLKKNEYKADGDGYFDININFENNGSNIFTDSSISVYEFILAGITENSFAFESNVSGGQGIYFTAAHVKNTPGSEESGWVAAVPIPSAILLLGSGLISLLGIRKKCLN